MEMQTLSRFTRPAPLPRGLVALTDDQIMRAAPSVFAREPHESRSARYTYLPTSDALAALRREGFEPVQVFQSRTRVPGKAPFTKHMLKFRHADARALAVGDCIPQVCLTNSHDGTGSWIMDLGVFRLVCLNGMMVQAGGFDRIKVPHIGNVLPRVIEGAFEVIDQAKRIGPNIEAMRAVQLAPVEQEIFARHALALRFDRQEGEETPVQPRQILQVRREEDRPSDLWTIFNRVQEGVIRGGQRYVTPAYVNQETGRQVPARRMHTRPVNGIDQNTALNRALWAMAEEMRALKSAA